MNWVKESEIWQMKRSKSIRKDEWMHEASEELSVVQCGQISEINRCVLEIKLSRSTEMTEKRSLSSKYRVRNLYTNIIELDGISDKFSDTFFLDLPQIKNVHKNKFFLYAIWLSKLTRAHYIWSKWLI